MIVAPNGELAAFCVCSIEEEAEVGLVGFADPIGTHPHYQRRGLAKAVVTAGMRMLQGRGVAVVKLGTSSQNEPVQRLAGTLGFKCVSEKVWFSQEVD